MNRALKYYTVVQGVVAKLMLVLRGCLKGLLILVSLAFVFAGTILICVSGLIEQRSFTPMQRYLASLQYLSSRMGAKSTRDI